MNYLTENYLKLALQLECRSGSWVARLDDEGDTFPIHIVSTEIEQDVREALDASPWILCKVLVTQDLGFDTIETRYMLLEALNAI